MARHKLHALALCLSLALLPALDANALGPIESLRFDLGVITQLNLDPSSQTPNLITNVLGAGMVLPFSPDSRWSFEPTVDLYWTYYELDNGKAFSTGIADRTAFVLGLLINAPAVYSIPFGGSWVLGLGAGLGINARVGFLGASDASLSDVGGINRYFWGQGRFLMPSTLLRIEYRLTARIEFGFTASAFWPLFNLWAADGSPFLDQAIFDGALVIRYRL
ncbi:MAG TPA: hypothetical protein VMC79_06805 [Rectinemataceae bacterium]|nr:hypothetical protein [Rectinemataceae bacterium]